MVEPDCSDLSLRRQSELLSISRSNIYYQKIIDPGEIEVMHKIDRIFTKYPFYGSRKITHCLRQEGVIINRKRTQRLMRNMGIEAIYQKPCTTRFDRENRIYPYLLRGVPIGKVNHVWSADITYIPMNKGYVYLIAIIDWFSRYLLSWKLSIGLEVDFCLSALNVALDSYKNPDIFNTDQGSQFTSNLWLEVLQNKSINISMDGKGRAIDNVFIERFFRSIKYEEIYINSYESVTDIKRSVKNYIKYYNEKRPHQSLNYRTPYEVYNEGN